MNDRQLRYALAVWRERSFSRAAERLNLSQPSVSEQVRLLEEELGFPLFERVGNGIVVTYPGRTFLHQADQAISDLLRLSDTARQLRGGPVGAIGIGFSTSLERLMLPRVMDSIGAADSRLKLEVTTATTRRVQRLVYQRRIDFGLTVAAGERSVPPDIEIEEIAALPLALAMRPDHPLAADDAAIPVTEIDAPLIVHEPDIGFGEAVASLFADHGLRPATAAVCDNMEAVRLMVAAGVGLAVIPADDAAPEIASGRLVTRPIRPDPGLSVTLVTRTGPHEPHVERLIEMVRDGFAAPGGAERPVQA